MNISQAVFTLKCDSSSNMNRIKPGTARFKWCLNIMPSVLETFAFIRNKPHHKQLSFTPCKTVVKALTQFVYI